MIKFNQSISRQTARLGLHEGAAEFSVEFAELRFVTQTSELQRGVEIRLVVHQTEGFADVRLKRGGPEALLDREQVFLFFERLSQAERVSIQRRARVVRVHLSDLRQRVVLHRGSAEDFRPVLSVIQFLRVSRVRAGVQVGTRLCYVDFLFLT